MAIAKFMAGMGGRGARIAIGLALIIVGLALVGGTVGIILAVVGIVPIVAGVFNFCLIAPILGAPFSGKDILES